MRWLSMLVSMLLAVPSLAADNHHPPPANANLQSVTVDGLAWSSDLAGALAQAAKQKKLVFIDFTGVTCINCKINEKNVFAKAEVKNLFEQFVRVQLYGDEIPKVLYKNPPEDEQREKDAEVNQKFQHAVFKTMQLPLYAIVKPIEGGQFEVIDAYDEGKISKIEKFLEFLRAPLAAK